MTDIFDRLQPDQGDVFDRVAGGEQALVDTRLRKTYPQMFEPGWGRPVVPATRAMGPRAPGPEDWHDVRAAIAPVLSGVTGGVASITTRLPDVLDKVLKTVGVPDEHRVTPLKLLNAELTVNNAYWEKAIKEERSSAVEKLLGKTMGGFAPGMLNWMGGVGLAAVEGATEGAAKAKAEGTSQIVGAYKGARNEALQRFILGKVLEGAGLIANPVLRRGAGGTVMGGVAAAEGATPAEALVQTGVGVASTGGRRALRRRAEVPITETATATIPNEPLSLKRAAMDEQAAAMGITPPPEPLRESKAEWLEKADAQDISVRAKAISEDVFKNPRDLDPVEDAILVRAKNDAENRWQAASKRRQGMSKTDPEYGVVSAEVDSARNDYDLVYRTARVSGRKWGQSGVARRDLANSLEDDASELSVLSRAQTIKGDKLSEPEVAKLSEAARATKEVSEKVDQLESAGNKQQAAETLGLTQPKKRALRRRGKPMPRGAGRYERMSETDKNAEIQDLLTQDADSANITRMAENIASRPDVKTFEDVLNRVGTLQPGLEQNTIIDAVAESGRQRPNIISEMTARFRGLLKGPAKGNKKLALDIEDALHYLKTGEARERPERALREEPEINRKLRNIHDMLRQTQKDSLPEEQARLEKQIKFLGARIANEDYAPRPRRVRPTYDKELYRQQAELAKRRAIVRQEILKRQPKTLLGRVTGAVSETARFFQGWGSSFDDSALMNQGGWQLRTHPIRTLKVQPEILRGSLSDAAALRVMDKYVEQSPDAWLYARDGVKFYPVSGRTVFTEGVEQIQSRWLAILGERLPIARYGIQIAGRAYSLTMNVLRARAYSALARTYAAEGGPTRAQGEAIAFHVNTTTGAIPLKGRAGELIRGINGIMWAPNFRVSQIANTFLYSAWRGGVPIEVRKQLLRDHAQHIVNGYLIGQTLSMLWGPPEKDPKSSYFLKWLIPGTHTYFSPFQQQAKVTSLTWQLIAGERKKKTGEIVPIRGPNVPFGGTTGKDLLVNWTRSGLAPLPAAAWDRFLTGEIYPTFEEATTLKTGLKLIQPVMFQNILETMKDDLDIEESVALDALSYFGASIQTELNQGRGAGPGPRRQVLRRRLP